MILNIHNKVFGGFPRGAVVKNLPANAGDTDLVPGLGRSPEVGNCRLPYMLSQRIGYN